MKQTTKQNGSISRPLESSQTLIKINHNSNTSSVTRPSNHAEVSSRSFQSEPIGKNQQLSPQFGQERLSSPQRTAILAPHQLRSSTQHQDDQIHNHSDGDLFDDEETLFVTDLTANDSYNSPQSSPLFDLHHYYPQHQHRQLQQHQNGVGPNGMISGSHSVSQRSKQFRLQDKGYPLRSRLRYLGYQCISKTNAARISLARRLGFSSAEASTSAEQITSPQSARTSQHGQQRRCQCCFVVRLVQHYGWVAIKWYIITAIICWLLVAFVLWATNATSWIMTWLCSVPYLGSSLEDKLRKYPNCVFILVVYTLSHLFEPLRVAFVVYKLGQHANSESTAQDAENVAVQFGGDIDHHNSSLELIDLDDCSFVCDDDDGDDHDHDHPCRVPTQSSGSSEDIAKDTENDDVISIGDISRIGQYHPNTRAVPQTSSPGIVHTQEYNGFLSPSTTKIVHPTSQRAFPVDRGAHHQSTYFNNTNMQHNNNNTSTFPPSQPNHTIQDPAKLQPNTKQSLPLSGGRVGFDISTDIDELLSYDPFQDDNVILAKPSMGSGQHNLVQAPSISPLRQPQSRQPVQNAFFSKLQTGFFDGNDDDDE